MPIRRSAGDGRAILSEIIDRTSDQGPDIRMAHPTALGPERRLIVSARVVEPAAAGRLRVPSCA